MAGSHESGFVFRANRLVNTRPETPFWGGRWVRCGPAWIARDPRPGSRRCGQAPVLSRKAAWAGERGARLARGLPAGKCLSQVEEKPGRGSAPGPGGTPTFRGREGSGRESAPCGHVGAIAGPACELGVKDRDRREEHGCSPPDPGRGRLPEVTKTDAAVLTPRGLAGPRDCSPGSAVAPGGGGDARRHGASSRDKPVARGCPRGQS